MIFGNFFFVIQYIRDFSVLAEWTFIGTKIKVKYPEAFKSLFSADIILKYETQRQKLSGQKESWIQLILGKNTV